MRKVGVALLVVASALLVLSVAATADPAPPGCHGQSANDDCRPDPQPDHGKDCESHGANTDGNEDHCLSTTITSTVSESPTATVTTTSPAPPTPSETTTTTAKTTSASSTTTTSTETVTGTTISTAPPGTTTTSVTEAPPITSVAPTPTGTTGVVSSTTSDQTKPAPSGPRKGLAFTGVEDVVPLAGMALVLLLVGTGLTWIASRESGDSKK